MSRSFVRLAVGIDVREQQRVAGCAGMGNIEFRESGFAAGEIVIEIDQERVCALPAYRQFAGKGGADATRGTGD